MFPELHPFEFVRKRVHEALRVQHPEWVNADGTSPMCDGYEARFAELLQLFLRLPRYARKSISRPKPRDSAFW